MQFLAAHRLYQGGTKLAKKKRSQATLKPDNALETRAAQLAAKCPWWIYLIAFFVPALTEFIVYALFKVFPFGNNSVLVLDLNAQYIYYFEAARDALWGDGSLFYSWSRNLSGGFMGIIGYYLASPFSLIIMLLPRTLILEGMMAMQLCKIGSSGVTFCYYLQKSKGVKPLHSVIFSTMYALMSYSVIQTIDPMWLDGLILLPLIVLGIEYLVDDGRKLNYIIPLSLMFVANFYIGFMIAIFTAVYFFYYLYFGTDKKFKHSSDRVDAFKRIVLSTIIVLMCSAFMLLPVYNALSLGKFNFSKPDYSFKTQFSLIELVPTFLPNQYYSVNVQGMPEVYCGVFALVLAPLFFMNKKIGRNKKIGCAFLLVILIGSMYIKPVDMLWHGGQVPNWLPYRYSFIVSFVLLTLGAECFCKLDGYKLNAKTAGYIGAGFLAVILLFTALLDTFKYTPKDFKYVGIFPNTATHKVNNEDVTQFSFGTILFGSLLIVFFLIIIYIYSRAKKNSTKHILTAVIAVVTLAELGINAYDTIHKADWEIIYSKKSSYQNVIAEGINVTNAIEDYDRDKNGNNVIFRSEKTFFRAINDNLGYGLKGISHSSSVMNTKILSFIQTLGYAKRSYVTRYDGNSSLADSLMGIRYVVHDPSIGKSEIRLNPNYQKIFTMDYVGKDDKPSTYHVYENPDALSIGYMASSDIKRLDHLGADNPFNSQNMFLSTLTGQTVFVADDKGYVTFDGNAEYYTPIEVSYQLANVNEEPYGSNQKKFIEDGSGKDPTIRLHITAQSNDEIFMYLKTLFQKEVNLWISTEKDENGNFINHKALGENKYFEGDNYNALRIGSYPTGTDIEVRLTLKEDKTGKSKDKFTIIKDFLFYHFNYDAFKKDIRQLQQNPWQLDPDKCSERSLTGTITAGSDQIMMTSIPYEPGWTVKVDGKKVEHIEVLNALIGVELTPGEHTVTMTYTPPGFNVGVFTLILGIGVIIMFYSYDRRSNSVLVARRKAREQKALGVSDEKESAGSEKKVQIIKSKGATENVEPVIAAINDTKENAGIAKNKKGGSNSTSRKKNTEKERKSDVTAEESDSEQSKDK